MKLIAPSILSANFLNLENELKQIEKGGGDLIHCDIMDGHFVPNLTFGLVVLKKIGEISNLPLDIHLMVREPEKFIPMFFPLKPKYLTVHLEAVTHLHRLIVSIKEQGIQAGVSINPATPVGHLSEILEFVDLVLVMTVNPGFGGQTFIDSSLRKIKELNRLKNDKKYAFVIEVDGGVTKNNISMISEARCDIFVAGAAIFGTDIIQETKLLKTLVNKQ